MIRLALFAALLFAPMTAGAATRYVRHADTTMNVYRILSGDYVYFLPTRKVVMPNSPAAAAKSAASGRNVAPGSSQSVAAAPVVLRFTLPAFQQGQPCADGAPLAWLDSARVVACKRGPSGPYSSAAWRAYLAQPDTVLAQHAVSWTRIGQPDSFTVAAMDTGATGWVQVRGTRGWSSVCRWTNVGAR